MKRRAKLHERTDVATLHAKHSAFCVGVKPSLVNTVQRTYICHSVYLRPRCTIPAYECQFHSTAKRSQAEAEGREVGGILQAGASLAFMIYQSHIDSTPFSSVLIYPVLLNPVTHLSVLQIPVPYYDIH